MAYGTVNADVIGTSVAGSNLGAGNASLMKNRIINGAMVIDQRNAGASVTATTAFEWFVDRWQSRSAVSSKFSGQQNAGSITPPVGFSNYLGMTSLSSYSVSSSDYFLIRQPIEGFNTYDLNWGTANAKTVTLSFQVYSSLTGTFAGAIRNASNGRSYVFTFSPSAANTWTSVSITIAGDTTGTWVGATNGIGMEVVFNMGAGSTYQGTANTWNASGAFSTSTAVNLVGTNGATFYITGVQLEVGSSATGFEYRQYGQELALCQRYYQVYGSIGSSGTNGDVFSGFYRNSSTVFMPVPLYVAMRTTPSFTSISASGAQFSSQTQDTTVTGFQISNTPTPRTAFVQALSSSAFAAGNGIVYSNNGSTTNAFSFSAEL